MTQRQESLKKEIIKLSDRIQLGIRKDDHDWFYMFVYRVTDKVVRRANTNFHHEGWLDIAEMRDLSRNFIDEFKGRLNIYFTKVMMGNRMQFTIHEMLKIVNTTYLCGTNYYLVLEIARDDRLTDAEVREYETLFDQTYGRCGNNAVPYNHETAWHYILNNKIYQVWQKRRFQTSQRITIEPNYLFPRLKNQ